MDGRFLELLAFFEKVSLVIFNEILSKEIKELEKNAFFGDNIGE